MILNILLATIFLLSFYMKAKKIKNLRYEVHQYQIVPVKYLLPSGIALLMVEFYLFIAFCTNMHSGITVILSLLFLAVLSLLTYRKRLLSGDSTCSCFGEIHVLNKVPIIRNLVIGIIVLIWWGTHTELDIKTSIVNLSSSILLVLMIDIVASIKTMKALVKNDDVLI